MITAVKPTGTILIVIQIQKSGKAMIQAGPRQTEITTLQVDGPEVKS
tara:strand:- start:392 stop:532 length:141 start_codon:yes stop_codon:yes gene_type:complete